MTVRLEHEFHVAVHRLRQLRIHLLRDSHDIQQQQAEIQSVRAPTIRKLEEDADIEVMLPLLQKLAEGKLPN
jgi:hypothetical protein